MTLPNNLFRDPSTIVKFESEKNKCKGCAFEMATMITGKMHRYCGKGKKHGERCKLFLR